MQTELRKEEEEEEVRGEQVENLGKVRGGPSIEQEEEGAAPADSEKRRAGWPSAGGLLETRRAVAV